MTGAPSKTSWMWLAALLAVFAGQVGSTWGVFNDTFDESFHIEAGLEYFQRGVYEYETQHPPLARVAVAALPYFVGGLRLTEDRKQPQHAPVQKPLDAKRAPGESFLWAGMWKNATPAEYWRTLTLARLGSLLFGLIAVVVVFLWTYELYGEEAAIAATALASFSPSLLAHSGLATLDAAAAATGTAAAYAFWRWTQDATPKKAALAGALLALAVCAKFSNLVYLLPALAGYVLLTRPVAPRVFSRQAAVAGLAGMFVVLAVYRFDFGRIAPEGSVYESQEMRSQEGLAVDVSRLLGSTPLPAPALAQGLIDVLAHNDAGHLAYLSGYWTPRGRLFYFPVALGVKTTLPLLVLAVWAAVEALRRRKLILLAAPAIPLLAALLIAMISNINIGVRHVLIAYPLMAIAAGSLFEKFSLAGLAGTLRNGALGALLVWHAGSSLWANPDYLPYFNELAGGSPQRILLDSNLDWGQDVARLGEWAEANGNPCIVTRLFTQSSPDKFGICNQILPASDPDAGWFAISINYLLGMEGVSPQLGALSQMAPTAVVGKSIYVYRIDRAQLGTLAPPSFFENYEAVGEPR